MTGVQLGRALYDFTGDATLRQLTFKKDDMIKVTNQFPNGWWAGELHGKVGYLPSTYVRLEGPAPHERSGTLPTNNPPQFRRARFQATPFPPRAYPQLLREGPLYLTVPGMSHPEATRERLL